VALAKALINRPDVLLLDEPTASLDPDTADWVRGYLEDYQRETTMPRSCLPRTTWARSSGSATT
jgi:ABC-type multidrug transport system ATPase subunit